MQKKKLSDLPLEKCIYMSVGPHAGESFSEIMLRKEAEIKKCGWSLWAHGTKMLDKIGKIPKFWGQSEEIYVLFSPTGNPTTGQVKIAQEYSSDGINYTTIDPQMQVTYSSSKSSYALVVEEYIEIDEADNIFHKGDYCEFKTKDYTRGVYFLEREENPGRKHDYRIPYVAKLRAPYNVKIK